MIPESPVIKMTSEAPVYFQLLTEGRIQLIAISLPYNFEFFIPLRLIIWEKV